jgi:hypothetical protein
LRIDNHSFTFGTDQVRSMRQTAEIELFEVHKNLIRNARRFPGTAGALARIRARILLHQWTTPVSLQIKMDEARKQPVLFALRAHCGRDARAPSNHLTPINSGESSRGNL